MWKEADPLADIPPMDIAQIQAALQSSQAKALLRLLEHNRDPAVTQAVAAAKAGDYSRAVTLLRPYLSANGFGGKED